MELETTQRSFQKKIYERYVGREVRVLVEGTSSKFPSDMTGHSACHKVVNFSGTQSMLGTVVDVRISSAKRNSLYGEVISAP